MILTIECDNCKEKFLISTAKNNLISYQEKYILDNSEVLYITKFDCPKCGKSKVVQIDNDDTIKLLYESKNLWIRLNKKRKKNKKITTFEKEYFEEKSNCLKALREKLDKLYSNKIK